MVYNFFFLPPPPPPAIMFPLLRTSSIAKLCVNSYTALCMCYRMRFVCARSFPAARGVRELQTRPRITIHDLGANSNNIV